FLRRLILVVLRVLGPRAVLATAEIGERPHIPLPAAAPATRVLAPLQPLQRPPPLVRRRSLLRGEGGVLVVIIVPLPVPIPIPDVVLVVLILVAAADDVVLVVGVGAIAGGRGRRGLAGGRIGRVGGGGGGVAVGGVVEGADGGLEGPVVALEEEGGLLGRRGGDAAEGLHQRLRLRGRWRPGGVPGGHLGAGRRRDHVRSAVPRLGKADGAQEADLAVDAAACSVHCHAYVAKDTSKNRLDQAGAADARLPKKPRLHARVHVPQHHPSLPAMRDQVRRRRQRRHHHHQSTTTTTSSPSRRL
ncbi:Os06g0634800, partial [Oryza sativa Japonica Group]